MEELVTKALDMGGVFAIAILVLYQGSQKLDRLECQLDKMMRIMAIGFNTPDKVDRINAIVDEK